MHTYTENMCICVYVYVYVCMGVCVYVCMSDTFTLARMYMIGAQVFEK